MKSSPLGDIIRVEGPSMTQKDYTGIPLAYVIGSCFTAQIIHWET